MEDETRSIPTLASNSATTTSLPTEYASITHSKLSWHPLLVPMPEIERKRELSLPPVANRPSPLSNATSFTAVIRPTESCDAVSELRAVCLGKLKKYAWLSRYAERCCFCLRQYDFNPRTGLSSWPNNCMKMAAANSMSPSIQLRLSRAPDRPACR